MKTYTLEQLTEILALHRKLRCNEEGGQRADLRGAYLSGADLSGADLSDAYLRGADLSGTDLRDADLRYADLRDADLRYADLRYADLSDANLRGAYLRGANLRDADLRGAYLRGVNTSYVIGQSISVVGNIGSRNTTTVYHAENDVVFCGCFRGSLEKFTKKVRSVYEEGNKHRKEYEIAIQLFELKRGEIQ